MKTIDEMLNLDLLTPEQHVEISDWIARANSPEEILQMPAPLWQAVERASEAMGVNADLLRPPALDAGGAVLDGIDGIDGGCGAACLLGGAALRHAGGMPGTAGSEKPRKARSLRRRILRWAGFRALIGWLGTILRALQKPPMRVRPVPGSISMPSPPG